MTIRELHILLNFGIAAVWLINGLFCKVFDLANRHEQIVGRILGEEFSRPLTLLIGLSEIGMAVWMLSGIKSRLNAITQITIVAAMNILEFALVPDLLLWGKLNSVFALLFILAVYYTEFGLKGKLTQQA
jgi:hypothetical protein